MGEALSNLICFTQRETETQENEENLVLLTQNQETKGTSWLRPGQSEVCIMAVKFQASHLTSLNLGFLKINNIYSDKNKN